MSETSEPTEPSEPSEPTEPTGPSARSEDPSDAQLPPRYPETFGRSAYPTPPPPRGRPAHPHAGLSLGLAVLGLAGTFLFGLGLLVAPFALVTGLEARREIAAEPGRWSGDDMALVGMVLGLLGTIALVVVVVVAAIAAGLLLTGELGYPR
jgi:hypothetical protein